jgi:hypothetical protein
MRIWERLLAISFEKKEFDGRLHVAKPTSFSNASISLTGVVSGHRKKDEVTTEAELEKAAALADRDRDSFRRRVKQEGVNLPQQSENSDVLDLNDQSGAHLADAASADKRILDVSVLPKTSAATMRKRELDQQRQDDDDMQDEALQTKVKDAKVAAAKAALDPKEEMRRLCVEFQTSQLEKVAKLEALMISTAQHKKAPVAELDYMSADQKTAAQAKQAEFSVQASNDIKALQTKVNDYKKLYGAMSAGLPASYDTLDKVKALTVEGDAAYKSFWGNASHQKAFYTTMKNWRASCEQYMKEKDKLDKTRAQGSALKRKSMQSTEFDEDTAPVCKCMKLDVEKSLTPTINMTENLAGFPARPLLSAEKAEEINGLTKVAQYTIMSKWQRKEITKSGDQDFTSIVANKKLLAEVKKLEGLLDSAIGCKTDIVFTTPQAELKNSLFGHQLTSLAEPHFDINVSFPRSMPRCSPRLPHISIPKFKYIGFKYKFFISHILISPKPLLIYFQTADSNYPYIIKGAGLGA